MSKTNELGRQARQDGCVRVLILCQGGWIAVVLRHVFRNIPVLTHLWGSSTKHSLPDVLKLPFYDDSSTVRTYVLAALCLSTLCVLIILRVSTYSSSSTAVKPPHVVYSTHPLLLLLSKGEELLNLCVCFLVAYEYNMCCVCGCCVLLRCRPIYEVVSSYILVVLLVVV